MDAEDIQALEFLSKMNSVTRPLKVRTYEVTRRSKTGTPYPAVITVYDEGPNGDPHMRYTAKARNKETGKETSSNEAAKIEVTLATLRLSELDPD